MSEIVSKKAVMQALYPHFRDDASMVLLAADMGFAVLDDFLNHHSERAFNVGICEQATVGVAAGMALAGMKPVIYSQIPFLVMRSYEQIRYDVCEHNLSVKMVGVGADNYFATLGRSHCMDSDDIAMLGIFKNLKILTPTPQSIAEDIETFLHYDGPVYLRCV